MTDLGLVVPVAESVAVILVSGMFLLGPVGRATGEAIRYWLAGGRRRSPALESAGLDELQDQLNALQHQVGEVTERLDFTERLLAQQRDRGALAGGGEG